MKKRSVRDHQDGERFLVRQEDGGWKPMWYDKSADMLKDESGGLWFVGAKNCIKSDGPAIPPPNV